jgi:DNA-binding FadR family transcriptional regulator
MSSSDERKAAVAVRTGSSRRNDVNAKAMRDPKKREGAEVTAALWREGPIRRRRLYQELVERIEAAIISGELVPGDQLPSERNMMESYQVGRTSVREALFALQRMGLVAIANGERARVVQPTPAAIVTELSGAARHLLAQENGVGHFQQARLFFETGLAHFAATVATPEDLASLKAALEANKEAIGNRALFAQTDVAFHFVLAQIPRNPIFTALHVAMVEWLTEQRSTSSRASGSNSTAYAAHRRIYEAIEARQPQAAMDAMRRHLEEVNRFYWKVKQHEASIGTSETEDPPISRPRLRGKAKTRPEDAAR